MAKLTKPARDRISATKFAFPKQRKEPLENASHVRNAVARFNQVKGVTEAERRAAWKRIQSAAKRFGVEIRSANTPRRTPGTCLTADFVVAGEWPRDSANNRLPHIRFRG
jgi:hypothetical protein